MAQHGPTDEHTGVDRLSRPDDDRPVLQGLLALVGVGLAIGLLAGLGTLLVTQVAGVGGGGSAEADSGDGASMYLPTPSPTESERGPGPLVSVAPRQPEKQPDDGSSEKASQAKPISLSAGQTSVSPMQRIDLTGTYPGGEGAVLQVQRKSGGSGWGDFPVTASVSGGTFSTYVQTSQTGPVRFRVVDTDSGAKSNPVTVRIG